MTPVAANYGRVDRKPIAVLHVGLAKCASTYLGDQALSAARLGAVSALVWRPFDLLINQAARELGIGVEAFPDAVNQPVAVAPNLPLFGTNECLTGHFPQPLRCVSFPAFTGEKMLALQERMAELLRRLSGDALGGFDVRILLVVRSPKAWLRSLYRNLVIMGVAQLPQEFFECFGPVAAQWANVDYLLSLYGGLFSPQNVCVLPMEMLRDDAAAFFRAVNGLAGAEILSENDARNVGLSDGASERFRKLWADIERIAPPQASWNDWTVRYKQQTWEFLHNAILNNPSSVARANETWKDDSVSYEMPPALVAELRSRMASLRGVDAFHPYLDEYFGP